MKIGKILGGVVLSLVFLAVFGFAMQGVWSLTQNSSLFLGSVLENVEKAADEEKQPEPPVPYRDWGVAELDLVAESGVVVEAQLFRDDKILYKKNSYTILPIASLTKLMTAVISLEKYDLSKEIIVSQDAVDQDGELGVLELGKTMSVNDLLYIMLIESSNHAAYALSEGMENADFVRFMNEKAREIDMAGTMYVEPTGLASENVSTADDLVKLAKYILASHPEIAQISRMKEYDLPNYGLLTNTDELLGEVPDIVVSKTGFTLEAKGCLFLVLNNSVENDYLIYVVMGADDRFAEMKKMIDWVKQAYKWQ